jgi:hypothetical protein
MWTNNPSEELPMNRTRTGLVLAALMLPAFIAVQGCSKPAETVAAAPEMAAPRHKILITAQVKDVAAWEAAFRTHGELFKAQGAISPNLIGSTDDNYVAVMDQTNGDLDAYLATLNSQETKDAMANDGVIDGTVKVFVLDREFAF